MLRVTTRAVAAWRAAALLSDVGPASASHEHQSQNRCGQGHRQTESVAFDSGSLAGFLSAGFLFGPSDLRLTQSLLDAGMIETHPLGHVAGIAGPVVALGSKARLGQRDQLGIVTESVLVEPGDGVGQFAARGLALDLARAAAGEGGLAGQKLAEDRAEREHVGTLVDLIAFATSLLGSHVGGRAYDRSPLETGRNPNRCVPWQ